MVDALAAHTAGYSAQSEHESVFCIWHLCKERVMRTASNLCLYVL